ncbi:MAG: tRNA 2-thiocytidine(32) synthetase TtcA [Pseudomonadota bacterium]
MPDPMDPRPYPADPSFPLDRATQAARRLFSRAPGTTAFQRLRRRLARNAETVIRTWAMDTRAPVGRRPRWLVCLSGGKDSYALLAILLDLKAQGRLQANLLACNLDQGQPGYPAETLPRWLSGLGLPYRIDTRDTYTIVTDKTPENQTYCALCSRLRRGHLYRIAREERCDAIVLGHHREDALATFMLNLVHGRRLSAMPAALRNDAGDVSVLCPLITSAEADLGRLSAGLKCPIIPCTLCGSQPGLQRQVMVQRLDAWARETPSLKETMLRALGHVRTSHLLDPRHGADARGDDPDIP